MGPWHELSSSTEGRRVAGICPAAGSARNGPEITQVVPNSVSGDARGRILTIRVALLTAFFHSYYRTVSQWSRSLMISKFKNFQTPVIVSQWTAGGPLRASPSAHEGA
jgi:hypothetical protein